MTPEIVILSPDDWQAYRDLRLEALRTEPQAFGTTHANMVDRPEAYWRQRLEGAAPGQKNWLFFAKVADRLVGMIGAFPMEAADEQPASAEVPAAEIVSVYITPSARGQGISRLMMQTVLDTLRHNGFRKAVLGVMAEQAPAIALYKSFGFQIVNTDSVLMGDGLVHQEYTLELNI